MPTYTSRAAHRGTTTLRSHRLARLFAGLVALLSMLVPVSTAAATPSPPTGLHVQGVSTNQVALAWDPVPNAKLYEFYANGSRVGSATRNTPATVASYMLTAGSSHDWTVRVTTADGQVSTQSAPLTVVQKSSATAVSSCGGTISNGAWTLSGDITLSSLSSPCFTLGNNASLDCLGHTISITTTSQTASVIEVSSGQHVLVANCKIKMVNSGGDDIAGIHVGGAAGAPSTAQYVTLNGNTFTGPSTGSYAVSLARASDVVVSNNTIASGLIGVFTPPKLVISGNSITNLQAWTNVAGAIWVHSSSGTFIGNNTINGGAPGGLGKPGGGMDDAILTDGITDGTSIRDNTISHTYDAGIEPFDTFTNGHIDGNTISGTDYAGIGQYYRLWMTGTTISDNVITTSPRAIEMIPYDNYGLPAGHTGYSFTGNTINNNTYTPPTGAVRSLCIQATSTTHSVAASGNVITNNKWGSGPIMLISPVTLATTIAGNAPNSTTTVGC